MYVVTVTYQIIPAYQAQFLSAVLKQAANSLSREPDCLGFEVSQDNDDPNRLFLYETYRSQTAFQQHRKTDYFLDYSRQTGDWVQSKAVETWHRLSLDGS